MIRAIDVSYSEGWSEQAETTRSKRAGDGMEGRERMRKRDGKRDGRMR